MRDSRIGLLFFVLLIAGCLGPADLDSSQGQPLPQESDAGACDAPAESQRIRAREIDLAVDPNDRERLAAAMMVSIPSTRQSPPDDEPVWTRILRSADGGRSWVGADLDGWPGSPTAALSPFAGSAVIGDPVLAFLPDGTLLMVGIMIRADYSYTMFSARFERESLAPTDVVVLARGAYGDPRLAQVPSPGTILYNDKEEVHVDPTTGTAYASWMWRHNDPTQGIQSVPVVVMSKDGGRSWTPPKMLFGGLGGGLTTEEGNIGQFPFTTRDGQAHIAWYAQRAKRMMVSSAPIGTVDFGPPRPIAEGVELASGARAITLPLPSVAVGPGPDGVGESAYVAWSDSRSGDADVLVVRSDDGARTWTQPMRAHAGTAGDGTDQLVPVVAVSPNGTLGVHYIGFSATQEEYDAFASLSLDGGASFSTVKIGAKPTRIQNATGQRASGIQGHVGDYFGAAFTDDAFVSMWQDGRDGTSQTPFTAAYACRLPLRE